MTETYRIEAIALHEVGVFDDVRIDFPPIESPERDAEKAEIHVFTGPNGCGKSTLLYALAAIFGGSSEYELIKQRFRESTSSVDFQFYSRSGGFNLKNNPRRNKIFKFSLGTGFFTTGEFGEYEISFIDETSEIEYGFGGDGEPRNNSDNLNLYKKNQTKFKNTPDHLKPIIFYAAFGYSGERTINQPTSVSIQEITASPFDSALSFTLANRSEVFLQWVLTNSAKHAFAKAEGDLASAARYAHSLERITNTIKKITDLDIAFKIERQPLSVKLKIGDSIIPFETMPDGLKSIISWLGDLSVRLDTITWADRQRDIFEQEIVLFLDEIDIHLHPKWQRKILPVVQKLFPNSQIFVSTHSPFVVGSVEDAWIYQLPEKGQQTDRIIKPVKSDPGKSYRLILKEIFDIDKDFGEETEALLAKFYHYRGIFLNEQRNKRELLSTARKLAGKGVEVRAIVERELRQLARVTGQALDLA